MKKSEKGSTGVYVLVGTYRPENADWIKQRKLYNLPLSDAGAPSIYEKFTAIVLYAENALPLAYAAKFSKVVDKHWLKGAGYSAAKVPHGNRYVLFTIGEKTSAAKQLSNPEAEVCVCSSRWTGKIDADFYEKPLPACGGKSMPNIFEKIKPYFKKWKAAYAFNPVQLEFPSLLDIKSIQKSVPKKKTDIVIEYGDSLRLCDRWDAPTVIVADGPYGLGSYPGDPETPEGLADFYRPFLKKWYELAVPSATLWFWNSEQGWANCHRVIEECGWEFRNCHIWDKGMSHVAGNCNTKTIRKYPVVTEVCVQYVRKNYLTSGGVSLPLREWMREEWKRTSLPFRLTNEACGVKDAATRKYFATDHLWYFPPSVAFVRIAAYANAHGNKAGRPYFANASGGQFSADEWDLMRAKFHCKIGVSNVWNLPPVRGSERIKKDGACLHMNQKPLSLLERIICSSSDPGDVVWEPFGGLCSTAIAAYHTHRKSYSSEINPSYFKAAKERLANER